LSDFVNRYSSFDSTLFALLFLYLVSNYLYYFFGDFGGFKDGVFPGVSLLSRARLSGFPVDLAILFGPGLSDMILVFN
jgi:hypothetical protein